MTSLPLWLLCNPRITPIPAFFPGSSSQSLSKELHRYGEGENSPLSPCAPGSIPLTKLEVPLASFKALCPENGPEEHRNGTFLRIKVVFRS